MVEPEELLLLLVELLPGAPLPEEELPEEELLEEELFETPGPVVESLSFPAPLFLSPSGVPEEEDLEEDVEDEEEVLVLIFFSVTSVAAMVPEPV